jgi:hypothetical protein
MSNKLEFAEESNLLAELKETFQFIKHRHPNKGK